MTTFDLRVQQTYQQIKIVVEQTHLIYGVIIFTLIPMNAEDLPK